MSRRRGTTAVTLGDRRVGAGEPAYVIAEAGVNHNGDPERAVAMVGAASRAGADAVKFQVFDPVALTTATAPRAEYQLDEGSGNQRDMLERLVIDRNALERITDACAEHDIDFLATPFDADAARLLIDLGVGALKVSSGDLTYLSFLELLAGFGVPLILSTGMATMAEVGDAVAAVRTVGAELLLLQCTSLYPTPPELVNLRAMATLAGHFASPVGLSDHTTSTAVPVAAVALGAVMVEKHFTLDRSLPGPDHAASMAPDDFAAMVRQIREVESALGNGTKAPAPGEAAIAAVVRRSLVAYRDIQAGTTVVPDMVTAKRPGQGISPARVGDVLGRTARVDISADTPFAPGMLE